MGAQAWLDQNWLDFWKEVERGGGNLTCHGDCNQESCPQIQGPSFGPKIQIQIQTEIQGALSGLEIKIQMHIHEIVHLRRR